MMRKVCENLTGIFTSYYPCSKTKVKQGSIFNLASSGIPRPDRLFSQIFWNIVRMSLLVTKQKFPAFEDIEIIENNIIDVLACYAKLISCYVAGTSIVVKIL